MFGDCNWNVRNCLCRIENDGAKTFTQIRLRDPLATPIPLARDSENHRSIFDPRRHHEVVRLLTCLL